MPAWRYDQEMAGGLARGDDVHGEANLDPAARRADGARRRLWLWTRGGRASPPRPERRRRRARGPDLPDRDWNGAEVGFAWVAGDLATLDLGQRFEAVLLAGDVMTFLDVATEGQVLERLAAHLEPGGHLVAGFHTRPRFPLPHLPLADYDALAERAGLRPVARSGDLEEAAWRTLVPYAVCVHRRPAWSPRTAAGGRPPADPGRRRAATQAQRRRVEAWR